MYLLSEPIFRYVILYKDDHRTWWGQNVMDGDTVVALLVAILLIGSFILALGLRKD